jgi:hypothetical protein
VSSPSEKNVALPPLLAEACGLTPTGEDRETLLEICARGASVMAVLDDLDLSPYEADDEGEEAYQVWEQLAPVVGETMAAVHAMLEVIDTKLTQDPHPAPTPTDQAHSVLRTAAEAIKIDMREFRDGMRDPEHMANRWGVLHYLFAFRGRTRHKVGEMLFGAIGCLVRVSRSDVVPFYDDDIKRAVSLRQGLNRLLEDVRIIMKRIEAGPADDPTDGPSDGEHLLARLALFRESEHYVRVRVVDHRPIVHALKALRTTDQAALRSAAMAFAEHLEGMDINRRAILQLHDRDAVRSAKEFVADAKEALRTGLLRARIEGQSAIRLLEGIEELDARGREQLENLKTNQLAHDGPQILEGLGTLEQLLSEFD